MKLSFKIIIYCFPLSLLLTFSACHSVNINSHDAHLRGTIAKNFSSTIPYQDNDTATSYKDLVDQNENVLGWYRKHEADFYHEKDSAFPKTCLALSGGGIRSAAYSIGVMKGLAQKEILQEIDIMSSVSGGSYALSWFYTQNAQENVVESMFSDDNIHMLATNADMYTAFDFIQSFVSDTALIPLNLLANGIFRWNMNTTPARANYEYEIRKLFQGGVPYKFKKVAGWTKKNKLPYFIINTTARIDADTFHHGSKLSNTVFEFTPLRFGSDAFGYGYVDETEYPFDFSTAVSVSGAAADSSAVAGDTQKVLLSVLNHDLGYYINNYSEQYQREKNWWVRLVPFPFYFLGPHSLRDKDGTDIYLSDGGHSETLGAFSLIRRACETIYIVDSEYDPDYTFGSYFKLKKVLKDEIGVDLRISDIDKVGRRLVCREQGPSGCIGVNEETSDEKFNLAQPIVGGKISAFPLRDPQDSRNIIEKTLKVIYIKLAIDEKALENIESNSGLKKKAIEHFGSTPVEFYLAAQKGDCGRLFFLECGFPQYSTVDQSYTEKQFRAYVDLGFCNVMMSKLIGDHTPQRCPA